MNETPNKKLAIFIIEDDVTFSLMLATWLAKKGFAVSTTTTLKDAMQKIKVGSYDLIISDLRLPDGDGIELLQWKKETALAVPFIVMTNYAEIQTAVQAIKLGASDYIAKPINPNDLLAKIQDILKGDPANNAAKAAPAKKEKPQLEYVVGESKVSLQLHEHARLVAPTDMSVLLSGSSGTGKEYVARYIHSHSLRKNTPFVAVDCGAIPKDLAASEFFGHIKGSFTGAIENKTGAFEAAQGGTIFLDEIGNLTYEVQVQLLRALQERKVRPIGSTQEIAIDVRLISATNENLQKAIQRGDFREDLYHRINEFTLRIPDLREREDDFSLFAERFLEQANKELQKEITGFDPEAFALMKAYAWPGNIRQLKNTIKYATLLATGPYISPQHLPKEIGEAANEWANPSTGLSLKDEDHERNLILKALKEADSNRTKAARLLGVDRKTLYNKMRQYGI
ncbi:sigma-54 dependent transcriptional regulator [Parabacteroides sp. PF5-6]|uniref:sigma-54-dependent transcriptional regulator n=1 Tax=Parabacteroides sp. PF5-6 TaxID=1742403 RepID=UPI002405F116|nr:sigma-54 dependent transcriptional regulator [Parabacteroides sp. PF5-6]MDF9829670.1 two-component system response regulator HydG [Parabacteroides sp. PF5-6]